MTPRPLQPQIFPARYARGGALRASALRAEGTPYVSSLTTIPARHRGSSTLSARATQRLVPSTRWRRSRRQTASRPKRDGCSERQSKCRPFAYAIAHCRHHGRSDAGPIPFRSAVRFCRSFRAPGDGRSSAASQGQAPHPVVASESAQSPSSQSSPFGAPSPRLAPQYAHALAVCAASAPSLRAQYTPLQ